MTSIALYLLSFFTRNTHHLPACIESSGSTEDLSAESAAIFGDVTTVKHCIYAFVLDGFIGWLNGRFEAGRKAQALAGYLAGL